MINKKYFLRTVTAVLCILTLISSDLTVCATSSNELRQKTSNLENQLNNLNSELSSLSQELDEASSQIEILSEKVEKTKLDLAAARLNEEIQYEAMSDRIRFMYEGGSISLLHILFTSENMGDFLNKAEYVSTISNYDRDMLKDFQQVRIDVENKQKDLEEQQKELAELQKNLTAKREALNSKISSTSGQLADYQAQLERAIAAEEALKQAQDNETSGSIGNDANQSKPSTGGSSDKPANPYPADVNDVALMAGILQCEAGGSYDGMIAVGTVIMNRVASPRFPNTIRGVVYQSGQFGPVSSGKLARVLAKGPNSSAYSAAKAVLGGQRHDKVRNCLYFNGSRWTNHPGVNIGGNIFW